MVCFGEELDDWTIEGCTNVRGLFFIIIMCKTIDVSRWKSIMAMLAHQIYIKKRSYIDGATWIPYFNEWVDTIHKRKYPRVFNFIHIDPIRANKFSVHNFYSMFQITWLLLFRYFYAAVWSKRNIQRKIKTNWESKFLFVFH